MGDGDPLSGPGDARRLPAPRLPLHKPPAARSHSEPSNRSQYPSSDGYELRLVLRLRRGRRVAPRIVRAWAAVPLPRPLRHHGAGHPSGSGTRIRAAGGCSAKSDARSNRIKDDDIDRRRARRVRGLHRQRRLPRLAGAAQDLPLAHGRRSRRVGGHPGRRRERRELRFRHRSLRSSSCPSGSARRCGGTARRRDTAERRPPPREAQAVVVCQRRCSADGPEKRASQRPQTLSLAAREVLRPRRAASRRESRFPVACTLPCRRASGRQGRQPGVEYCVHRLRALRRRPPHGPPG